MRLSLIFLSSLLSQLLFGQCDELVTSFGSGGYTAINVGNQSGTADNAIATFTTDEHIIIVGNILINSIKQGGVAYFNHDGSFIKKIKIGTSHFISNDYTVQAACLQHDGKLLVTGHVASFFGKGPVFIARVNVDGTMDNSYGNEGIITQYFSGYDFNYMSNIIQDSAGSITARGRAKPHGGSFRAIKVSSNASGSSTDGDVFTFESFSTSSFYEFINGSVFKIVNGFEDNTITLFSGNAFPLGNNDTLIIDNSLIDATLTGISILSNNRLAAHGYTFIDDIKFPVVFVLDESGNFDLSFNDSGYKILDISSHTTADVELFQDIYYVTTTHDVTGASMHKLNLDGTAMHDSWSSPYQSTYPIIKNAEMLLRDTTMFIAGEIHNDGQSDFGLVKYKPCDYHTSVTEEYPLTPIGELKEVDTQGIPVLSGRFSTIGVVASINFLSDNDAMISIMDEENDGIFITGSIDDFEYIPTMGDELIVSGLLQSHFESTAELIWRQYRIESKNNPIPTPVSVNELNTYSEGVYVQLDDVTLVNTGQWKGDGSTFTVSATDGANVFDIKIFDTSYWSDKPAPQGELRVSGIGGQDDQSLPYLSEYEIYPQLESDIVSTSSTHDISISGINISPNPSTTRLYLNDIDLSHSIVRIVNTSGISQSFELLGNSCDISTLKSGLYILTIEDQSGSTTHSEQFITID